MRLKSTVVGLLAVGCLLIVLGFLWVDQSIEHQKVNRLRRELHDQASLLSSLLDSSSPDIDRRVDEVSRHVPYRITVITENGRVVADSNFSGEQLARLENHSDRTEVVDAKQSGSGDRIRYSTSLQAWLMYSAVRLRRSEGYVRIAVPAPERAILAPPLRLPLALMLLGAVLGGFILNYRIKKAIDRPRSRLEKMIGEMGEGKLVRGVGIPSTDDLGPLARSLETLAEKTEQRTQWLESESENLKAVLMSMSEAVLITDTGGRIARINPAAIEIFNLERDPLGRRPLEVVRSPLIEDGISTILRNIEKSHHEVEIRVDERVLLARFARLERTGSVLGVVIVFHDITRLRRLENVRKEFISNLSHEFRTPLTSIQGFAETLLQENCDSAAHRNFLPKIYRNSQQLSQMIEELFKLASLEARSERLEKQLVSFNSLVGELRDEFGPRLAAKGIEFIGAAGPGAEYLLAHEGYLRRIFHNLVDNAVKYTNQGVIKIETTRSDEEITVAVSDTGMGIPAEDLNRVFERFYRVDKDRSRETGGSGIGLALVKHLVQVQGGRVWAESVLGRGSTFYFSLPSQSRVENLV